ncbi:RecB family exonuclease [Actinoplanes sp. NPDC049265]|uniref:RecB family exonuclease n=1 Tax=Actinoplanes sp. NPDC049265 TaxID=3363902 RepID=UPI00371C0C68
MTVTESSGTATTFTGPSLSPSRAADFKTCPLLFRFRTIDRLPEQPTPDQVRGTLVHAVLERLFDLPPVERTRGAAESLVEPQWLRLVDQEPALSALFDPALPRPAAPTTPAPSPPGLTTAATTTATPTTSTGGEHTSTAGIPVQGGAFAEPMLDGMPLDADARLEAFFASARDLLGGYFAVEDPTRLEPAEREALVSTLVDEELLIRGYIDRLDVSPGGDLRVVDYKTGGAPREAFEGRALFQLKFYALVLWRTRGVVPRVLRLLYLKDQEICDYSPDAEELERFERTLVALSQAIERAKQDRDFRAKPSKLCGWCSHQARCPEFGGTPPPYPERAPDPDAPPEDLLSAAD